MLERRQFLARMALLAGGVLSPGCAAWLAGGDRPRDVGQAGPLSGAQRELVGLLCERILPATDTPGARDAGVPAFIEMMLAGWLDPGEAEVFTSGLLRAEALARESGVRGFAVLDGPAQDAVLTRLEQEALAGASPLTPSLLNPLTRGPAPARFFTLLKELVVIGYYTSEIGATQELRYHHIAGHYRACFPMPPGTRAWAE